MHSGSGVRTTPAHATQFRARSKTSQGDESQPRQASVGAATCLFFRLIFGYPLLHVQDSLGALGDVYQIELCVQQEVQCPSKHAGPYHHAHMAVHTSKALQFADCHLFLLLCCGHNAASTHPIFFFAPVPVPSHCFPFICILDSFNCDLFLSLFLLGRQISLLIVFSENVVHIVSTLHRGIRTFFLPPRMSRFEKNRVPCCTSFPSQFFQPYCCLPAHLNDSAVRAHGLRLVGRPHFCQLLSPSMHHCNGYEIPLTTAFVNSTFPQPDHSEAILSHTHPRMCHPHSRFRLVWLFGSTNIFMVLYLFIMPCFSMHRCVSRAEYLARAWKFCGPVMVLSSHFHEKPSTRGLAG